MGLEKIKKPVGYFCWELRQKIKFNPLLRIENILSHEPDLQNYTFSYPCFVCGL